MIETRVRVISANPGARFVEMTEHNGCGACGVKDSCGISGLGKFFSRNRQPVELKGCDGQAGDELLVSIEERDLLMAGLWAYILPAVLAIAAAATVSAYGQGDAMSVLAALGGMAAGLLTARLFARAPRMQVRNTSLNQPL